MKVAFFDLSNQFEQIKNDITEVLVPIFETQRFILGKNVVEFEKAFAEYCGTKYAKMP